MKKVVATLLACVSMNLMDAFAADVTIVKDSKPDAIICVSDEVMAADKEVPYTKAAEYEQELQRRGLRESVKDLAMYLEKISDAKIEIKQGAPDASEARIPILISDLATKQFGPAKKKAGHKQGFRVVVSAKGIGLLGESDLAASYAIYEMLDRLGCRWYMPSEMGEVIPQTKTIRLKVSHESLAPGTLYRGIWYADDAFRRRNRMGGLLLSAGHALEIANYITKEQLAG